MSNKDQKVPDFRPPTLADFKSSLALGWQDFRSAPLVALFFASFFAGTGLIMALITYWTGQTFWLVLAILGFPLVGSLATVGFYEISRCHQNNEPVNLKSIAAYAWKLRLGQLPWLATIIVVIFLFWFFLGHMIFALFLGLSPMTHTSTSLTVLLTSEGAMMIAVGTAVGAVFATLVFALSVHGIPMVIERDVDFMTAMLRSISAVLDSPMSYLAWGGFIGAITLLSMAPFFLGLFITIPLFGHASWHLYRKLSE